MAETVDTVILEESSGFIELSCSEGEESDQEETPTSFFTDLDAPFVNYTEKMESMRFSGTDVAIRYFFDLPIQVVVPGSTVKYEFETEGGDIDFGINFISPDEPEPEEIITVSRMASDVEPIKGQFRAPSEGVVMFRWNNEYSWFASKSLSYMIEMAQPSAQAADTSRCLKAKSMLHALVEDTRKTEKQLSSTKTTVQRLTSEIEEMNEQVQALVQKMNVKTAAFKTAEQTQLELTHRLVTNEAKKTGLCIRMLNKTNLLRVFYMLPKEDKLNVSLACKYWNALLNPQED